MGVGQPLSMKLKNVHLPHPHPNGVFREPSFGGRPVLSLCFAALVVGLSEVTTTCGARVRDVRSVVAFWVRTSTESGVYTHIVALEQTSCIYTTPINDLCK